MFLLAYLVVSLPLLVSPAEIGKKSSNQTIGQLIKTIEEKCMKSEGATKDDLIRLHDLSHLGESRASKCMEACAEDEYGTFDEQGAPDVYKLEAFARAQFKPEDQNKFVKVWMDCFTSVTKENIADHCEHVFKVAQCSVDRLKQENIKAINFWNA